MNRHAPLFLILAVLLPLGCTSSSVPQKEPWRRVAPWEPMSPAERDRTAVADLVASEQFRAPSCRWLKYGAWVLAWPAETALYRAASDQGYIEMEQVGTDNRIGEPEPAWKITITDAGQAEIADCKVHNGHEDWGVPVSRRKFISARYLGDDPGGSGDTTYEVVYQWVPTAVGEQVKDVLKDNMAVEEGKYRAQVWLRKNPDKWYVDQLHEGTAERID